MDESSMLSIKKFADLAGVSPSALRYYDQIGIFSPAARGRNQYRYYLPHQMIMLNFINVLADIGFPLSKAKELIRNRTPKDMLALLMEHESILDRELLRLQAAYSVIHTFQHNIQTGLLIDEKKISLEYKDETAITMGPLNDWTKDKSFYNPFMIFCKKMTEEGHNLNYPTGGYFKSMDCFSKSTSQPTCWFSLEPNGKERTEQGYYIVGYVRGYYGQMGDIDKRIKAYADENNLDFSGPLYVIYLHDEICMPNKDEYLSQVSARVTR